MSKHKTGFQSYDEAQTFLYHAIDYEKLISYQYNASTFSLDRMVRMLEYVGNPHTAFPSVHITGTKGKGSTSIMIATILEHSGLKTGLFTSPHLIDIKERIQINRQDISKKDFVDCLNELRPYIQRLRDTEPSASPTFFEILTALCMIYFRKNHIDMAVLEVGMGGRLDSTNVVIPRVSIITNIGLDHTAILGNTLVSIALEKAGIIKQGIPVVSAVEAPDALSVIEKTCREKDAQLYLLGRDIWVEEVRDVGRDNLAVQGYHHIAKEEGGFGLTGSIKNTEDSPSPHTPVFPLKGLLCKVKTWRRTYDNIFLPLIGIHQAKNCALALGAVEILQEQHHISVSVDTIRDALTHVYCPARIEVIGKAPFIILDYAHTVDSMRSLKNTILQNFTFDKLILVLGFSQDKDLDNILREIVSDADSIVVTRSKNPRAATPEDLYLRILTICGKQATVTDSTHDAVITAKQKATKEDLICITGSAYIAGEAIQA